MAKDNKNKKSFAAEAEEQVTNAPENLDVEARIKSKNCIDESIAELGDLKEEEDKKQEKIAEYLRCKNKALYFRDLTILIHNKNRREEHALNECIKKSASLLDDLKAGKITPREYDEAWEEFAKEHNKKIEASNKKHDSLVKELRDAYPGYYSNQWELERLGLIKRAMRGY